MTHNHFSVNDRRLARSMGVTLLTILIVAIGTTIAATAYAAPGDFGPNDNRLDVSLNSSWKFHLGDVTGAQGAGFDDSGWTQLDLPHTWNNLDGQDGGGNYTRGIGWYRKHYTIPSDYAGKQIFLRFEAVSKAADVYVNGTLVGQHAGGFAAFALDITHDVSVGADNVIAVKANNAASLNIAPLSGDFNQDGGIYRPVHLLATHKVHVTPLDYGSPGIYLTPSNVSASSADLQVVVKVDNAGNTQEAVTVQTTIRDTDGTDVATLTSTQDMAASSSATFLQNTTLANPHLWNGKSDPYLYQAIVEVKLGDTIVDGVEQPLGFRYFQVDPNTGFTLNGIPLDLHGAGMHENREDKGRAISDADRSQDIDLIMEMGATFVRLAHYQHAETTYDLCDENGLVVWTEIPLVVGASSTTEFTDNIKEQLRELIRQNYNHPSVFFWGLYNNIGTNTLPLIAELSQLAHQEDATRLTTGASPLNFSMSAPLPTDLVAWHVYLGWYGGYFENVVPTLTNGHTHHPYLGISEYGAGASIHQHEDNPPAPDPYGGWHPEEYQNIFHEIQWQQLEAIPFLWVKSVWTAFDFASDSRDEGDRPGINDKGLITFDRSVKKDAFYWYKANWSDEPVVYITSRRFTPRANSLVEVKVYSNCDSVELLVSGLSYESKTSTDHIYKWTDVILAGGDNVIRAVCTKGVEQYEDSITWDGGSALSPLPAGLHQETDSRIVYTGAWTSYTGSEPNGGSTLFTIQQNATVRFDFEGTGLRLYRTTASDRGPMQVCVDTVCQTVQNDSPTTQWNQVVTIAAGLAGGTHKASIRNLTAGTIDLDAAEILLPPGIPTLLSPADGSTIADGTPIFDWGDVTGAAQYQIQVDDSLDFSSPEIDVTETSSAHAPASYLANGTYVWRVRAQDIVDIWGNWSAPWAVTIADDDRLDISLNSSWKFHLGDVIGAQGVGFNDSGWTQLDLPHTWNNLDGQDGGSNYTRGIGWYRKHYTIPSDYAGKRIFLRFEAVSKAADVYVNGAYVGRHEGSFAAFAFDVTGYVTIGADNVIAVKANNAATVIIAPLSGDFNQDGGIYRPVHLLATHKVHVTPLDYGSPGVYLTPSNVSASSADLQVVVKVDNAGNTQEAVTVQTTIRDADGTDVATLNSTQDMAASSSATFVQNTALANPHLWNGRSDPYLYQVIVEVKLGDTIVDGVEQPLGFRYFQVDPNTGFTLNGIPLDMHGVAMHEGRENKGRAISDADRSQDIDLLMEMGATFVRLAHYQHAETTYDLCDENGLVVWTEVPLVNSASSSTAFADNTKQQLRELIRQNYNHPSVLFWGLYNEITSSTTNLSLAAALNDVAHQEDATRPTTAANLSSISPSLSLPGDLIAWNLYYGWYGGTTANAGPVITNLHTYHPYLGVSEYGAGASIYHHEENPAAPVPNGKWHPEEYQNLFHESYWTQMKAMPFLWTKTIWVAFDFAVDSRNEGDRPGINDKGMVTFDRSVKKDTFYWYKANWSDEPVVYITSRRFTSRDNNHVEVKVYSNCDSVELLVSGFSQGSKTSTDHIYRWSNVILASGNNAVRAVCTIGTEQYEDSIVWDAGPALSPLPAGLHQETDSRIVYTGVWTSYTGSEPNGGSTLITHQQNAIAKFDFEGMGLRLYRTMASTYGPMQVCVDGVCQTVNNYSATTQWNQMVSIATGLANGTHRVVIRNLTTAYIDVDAIEVGPPAVPSLKSPADGSTTADSTPDFDWGDVTGATQYQIQVDDNADFSSPEVDVTTTTSAYTSTLELTNGTYSWRVRAANIAWSNYSGAWTVIVAAPPAAPILTSPADGLTTADSTPDFEWGDVAGATQYQIQADDNADFSSPEIDTTMTASAYTPAAALADGMYHSGVFGQVMVYGATPVTRG